MKANLFELLCKYIATIQVYLIVLRIYVKHIYFNLYTILQPYATAILMYQI